MLDEGRAPAPLTSSKSAFPRQGPAGPETEMDGSGCLWKKAPWLRGQGERAFQEGRGSRFWLLLGAAGGGRGRACVRRPAAGPHLNHRKELLEFPPLCTKTGRRVLGATDRLPCELGHPTHLGLELRGVRCLRDSLGLKVWPGPSSVVPSLASHIPLLSLSGLKGEMTVPAS